MRNFGFTNQAYPLLFVPEIIRDLVGVVVLQVNPDVFGVKNHADFAKIYYRIIVIIFKIFRQEMFVDTFILIRFYCFFFVLEKVEFLTRLNFGWSSYVVDKLVRTADLVPSFELRTLLFP